MRKDSLVYFPAFNRNCLRACMYNYLLQIGHAEPLLHIDSSIKVIEHNLFSDSGVTNTGLYKREAESLYVNYGEIGCVWEQDKKMLRQGIPLIFDVDVFYLPYRDEFRKKHGSHGVICERYDEDNVKIVDWSSPHFFCGNISIDCLLKSRASDNPYSDNPFSGMSLNSFSLGIKEKLEEKTTKRCIEDWVSETYIDFDYIDKMVNKIERQENVRGVCDYWYLVLRDIDFAYFFVENMVCNHFILQLLDDLRSLIKVLNVVLLKFCLKPQTDYINRGFGLITEVRCKFRLLDEQIKLLL